MSVPQFIFSPAYHYRRHIFFWFLYFVLSVAFYFHPGRELIGFDNWLSLEICEVLANMLLQVALCYFIMYHLIPLYLLKRKYISFTVAFFAALFITYWIYLLQDYFIARRIHFFFGMNYPEKDIFAICLMNLLLYYPIPIAVTMVIKLLKTWYAKQKETETLMVENTNAEIQLLKAQIHPHFLFNTLNNIYSFTLNKSPKAGEMVLQLSDMMKYMINDCKTEYVGLSKELKMMDDYIGLEKVRYGSRLNLQIEVTGDCDNKAITPLLMIPFLENSFKHGASKMLRDPWMKLFIQADEDLLHFILTNSKPADDIVKGKGGIGLNNVKKRLELLYPSNHLLTIESTTNTFTVNMRVPLQCTSEMDHYITEEAMII